MSRQLGVRRSTLSVERFRFQSSQRPRLLSLFRIVLRQRRISLRAWGNALGTRSSKRSASLKLCPTKAVTLGHNEATLNAIAKTAALSPDSGEIFASLGFGYINLNRVLQAIPPLQRAAKLLPQDYLVQSQLGYCLLITGQTDAAIGYLKKGASLNSKYGPVWEHLGVAYKKQGRNRDAVSALETATRLMPSSHVAWKHLAEAYQATGRTADAQRAAARAQQLGGAVAKASKKKA